MTCLLYCTVFRKQTNVIHPAINIGDMQLLINAAGCMTTRLEGYLKRLSITEFYLQSLLCNLCTNTSRTIHQ